MPDQTAEVTAEVMDTFGKTGAYLKGHFRLTSGPPLQRIPAMRAGVATSGHCGEAGKPAGGAASGVRLGGRPRVGRLIIGHEVARAKQVRFVFTERDGSGNMTLRRGFTLQPGERAVVIEDVVTTGGSTREVMRLLEAAGVTVLAAAR